MNKNLLTIAMLVLLSFGLIGCSDLRRAIGSEKSRPDEFEVVVRPPLSLPPGFYDRPEDIVEQDQTVGLSAEESAEQLLAVGADNASGFEQIFDFSQIPSDIRTKVDEETYGIQLERRLPIQELFGDVPDIGPVLNKMAEDARLRKARLEGRLPTEESTLAIDSLTDEPVAVQ
jgi:hypothetical protein